MDTQKITNEILATGLTQQELADLIPCGQSTIAAFVKGTRGSNPRHSIAMRLLELHAARCVHSDGVRVTAPELGRGGRQPPSPANIFDTVPTHSVVGIDPPGKA